MGIRLCCVGAVEWDGTGEEKGRIESQRDGRLSVRDDYGMEDEEEGDSRASII